MVRLLNGYMGILVSVVYILKRLYPLQVITGHRFGRPINIIVCFLTEY